MKPPLTQDADVLNALTNATMELGFDVQDAAMNLGLPPDLLKAPEHFVPSQLFNCLLESIATDYHCHDIALRVAQHLDAPRLGLPARVMELSPNFRTALEKAAHFGAFYRDTSPWQHQICNKEVTLFKLDMHTGSQFIRQRSLLGTAQMFLLIYRLSGQNWRPYRVSLSFSDPGARFSDTFKTFFNCEIAFNQPFDAVHFADGYLDFNIATADEQLLIGLEAHIESLQKEMTREGDLLTQAKLIINQRLNFGSCSLEELAHELTVSVEELTGELTVANLTFDQLLEQQISEKANYYLTEFHAPTELILSALMPNDEPRLNELLMAKIGTQHQW